MTSNSWSRTSPTAGSGAAADPVPSAGRRPARPAPWLPPAAVAALAAVAAPDARAIVIRHDVAPARYEARESDFPAVFRLGREAGKACAATVVHRRWALTAAHCVDETGMGAALAAGGTFAVRIAGRERRIVRAERHPDHGRPGGAAVDLALLRLERPSATPRPVPLAAGGDGAGTVLTLLGWGFFGLGTVGRQYGDGRLRRAENRVEAAGPRLRLRFDDPREAGDRALPLEGTISLGDSGGPALAGAPGARRLAGVAVGQLSGADYAEETQGRYGAVAVYERISRHLDWIRATLAEDRGPSRPASPVRPGPAQAAVSTEASSPGGPPPVAPPLRHSHVAP